MRSSTRLPRAFVTPSHRHRAAANDPVARIAGTFSGTLGYVMTGLQAGRAFSEIVAEAKALGYTEPDPRDDLGGTDVARKVRTSATRARALIL